jgi:hypothetical protein
MTVTSWQRSCRVVPGFTAAITADCHASAIDSGPAMDLAALLTSSLQCVQSEPARLRHRGRLRDVARGGAADHLSRHADGGLTDGCPIRRPRRALASRRHRTPSRRHHTPATLKRTQPTRDPPTRDPLSPAKGPVAKSRAQYQRRRPRGRGRRAQGRGPQTLMDASAPVAASTVRGFWSHRATVITDVS